MKTAAWMASNGVNDARACCALPPARTRLPRSIVAAAYRYHLFTPGIRCRAAARLPLPRFIIIARHRARLPSGATALRKHHARLRGGQKAASAASA